MNKHTLTNTLSLFLLIELVYQNTNSTRTISQERASGADYNEGDLDSQYCNEVSRSKLKIPVISESLPISVAEFFQLFMADDAPHSFQLYYESQKSYNVSVTKWGEMSSLLGYSREMKFIKPLYVPGLSSTRCTNVQRYRRFSEQGLVVCESTCMEDVPGASTFTVEDMIAVKTISKDKISLEINFEVRFIKSTMFRVFIEKSTGAEMQKYFIDFYAHVKRICEEHRKNHPSHVSGHGNSGSKRVRSSGRTSSTLRGSPASARSPKVANNNNNSRLLSETTSNAVASPAKSKSKWAQILSNVWEECKIVGLKILQMVCVCILLYGIVYTVQMQLSHADQIRRLLDLVAALSEQQKVLQNQVNDLKEKLNLFQSMK